MACTIEVRGLVKRHGAQAVLKGIDAEVERGETIALVGPSGGGKSTFLRCLNGLNPFEGGEIRIAGQTLAANTAPDSPALIPLRARVSRPSSV